MIGKSITFNSLVLGAFALCTAGIVALTHDATDDKIVAAKQQAAQAALAEVIPADQHDNDLFNDTLAVAAEYRDTLGLTSPEDSGKKIHLAKSGQQTVAAIIPTTAKDGYSGDIKMILGVYRDGTIAGLRVTEQHETPGLGDYIDIKKGNWILSFNGKDIHSNFDNRDEINPATGEKFDQLTGATITRKAVTRQVLKTLTYFENAKPIETLSNSQP